MEIIMRCVNDITPYEHNPRRNDDAVDAVAASIKEFGFKVPIVIDKDGIIVAGHTRLKAAKKLGMEQVPCIVADDLTDEQIKAFRLADNKVAELADWDFSELETELADIDMDMSQFGFDDFDIDENTEIIEDEAPEPPEEPKAKRGQIYQLGKHRLMCGDATNDDDVATLLGTEKAAMLMTDPPYGINAEKMTMGKGVKDFYRGECWDEERPQMARFLPIAENVCIWGGNYFANELPISNDWLVWHKKNDGLSFSECELAWTNFGRNTRHISHHWGNEKKLHVTMKPVSVMAWAINQCKEKTGIVLDLFGGSGSTLIACEQLGRICYMMELDPHYIDVIIERWENLTGQKAVLLNG